jgi:D-sedoheptulose 7-phosphate isomerase
LNTQQRIVQHFNDSIATKKKARDQLQDNIAATAVLMHNCLASNHKIMSCGNGGSAGDAQHFSSELINRFETERQALAAIALTTDTFALTSIANDYAYENIFSRQVEALGKAGDILLAFSTSGNSKNVIKAIQLAQKMDITVVALTGKDGGAIRQVLSEVDIELCVPSNSTARIQEVHLVLIHCLCDLIDQYY